MKVAISEANLEGINSLGNSVALGSVNLEGIYCHQNQKFVRGYCKHHYNSKKVAELKERKAFLLDLKSKVEEMETINPHEFSALEQYKIAQSLRN